MNNVRTKPLVSVVMPVRNAEEFLRDSLESIFRQTYRNFEVLLVDDASEDRTWQIMKEYEARFDGRVRIFRLRSRRGAFGAINSVYPQARGEFIALMDADDISHHRRFEKQIDYLEKHQDLIVLGTQANIIDGEGVITGRKNVPLSHEQIYEQFALVHPMIHPSCMIRKKLIPANNKALYEDRFGVNSDYFTFFKFLKLGKFANLPEFLLDYRIHNTNSSLQNLKRVFFNTLRIRIAAAREFEYKFSLQLKALIMLQLFLIVIIPNNMLFPLYLVIRGIRSPYLVFIEPIIKSIQGLIPEKIVSASNFQARLKNLRD